MKNLFLISSVLFIFVLLSSCESDDSNLQASEIYESNMMYEMSEVPAFTTDSTNLTVAETEGLLQMREEEKLALDVYDQFYETYKLFVFDRISNSESRHTNAVLSLINYYELTDPATSASGKFSNSNIQNLYNQLISAGTNAEEALKTGAFIEEYDIADLKKQIEETENIDIKTVYTHLLRGSEMHLRAFVRNLKVRGIVYEHQILSSEDYETIASGESIAPEITLNGQCIMN